MMKTAAAAAAIVLFGVAVGFSGLLGGEESVTTEAATDAAFAAATTAHASAAATASSLRAEANGPTPEICARILTQLANATIGDPEDRNPPANVAAANHAASLATQRQLAAAGCTSAYINANGEAIMALVNRGRSPSQQIR